jgi:hypothetical protein
MTKTKKLTGIQRAVLRATSNAALGEACGVTVQAVGQWVRNGYAPRQRIDFIEKKYGIPAEELCNPKLLKNKD